MELQKSGLLPENVKFDHLPTKKIEELADATLSLLNLIGVDTNRDTHYQTKEEMELVRKKLHRDVFAIDRGIYSAIFCLPGAIEFARQGAFLPGVYFRTLRSRSGSSSKGNDTILSSFPLWCCQTLWLLDCKKLS